MMGGTGWIKLHRRSLDSVVFQNANLWQVWCFCLMRANHEPTKIFWNGKEMVLKPGQFLTGRFEGSRACHMKPGTFRDQLARLKSLQSLDIKSDNRNSLITVLNWRKFQEKLVWLESGPTALPTGHPTTNRQQPDTDKNVRMKEKESVPTIAERDAEEVYEHYRMSVKAGAASDAKKSIKRLLTSGFTKEQLIACTNRYAGNGMSSDRRFRIQANNFWGRAERFKDYLRENEEPEETVEQDLPQFLARELVARGFESRESFTWKPGTELVHYSGHKDPLTECRRLGLTRKGVQA